MECVRNPACAGPGVVAAPDEVAQIGDVPHDSGRKGGVHFGCHIKGFAEARPPVSRGRERRVDRCREVFDFAADGHWESRIFEHKFRDPKFKVVVDVGRGRGGGRRGRRRRRG